MKKMIVILTIICTISNIFLFAQSRIKIGIKIEKITENFHKIYVHNFVYMLVFNGPQGAILIDTGFEPIDLIDAELKKIGVEKIRYIVNTHSHGDHVEGNAFFGKEAVIISSNKCRDMLLEDENFPKMGLPNLTFSDSMSIHLNDEEINLYFLPGHSDSDIIVHFEKSNILCIGDFGFFKRAGNWPGLSANAFAYEKSMMFLTTHFSDDALIICGHHSEYAMSDIKLHTEMISEAINSINPLIQQGLTLDQIKEQNPLKNSSFSMLRENSHHWIEDIFRSSNSNDKIE